MLVLQELVDHALTEIGHLLVPIDVFGFTNTRLEQLMISTLNKFQQYQPLYKKVPMTINSVAIIKDAQRVFALRPFSTSWEYSSKFEFKDWDWDVNSQTLTTTTSGDFMVQYLGKYTVEVGTPLTYTTTELFPEETQVLLPLLGHFKKGTLNITLDEGIIPTEIFTVNDVSDTFTVPPTSVLYSKLVQSSIVRVVSDTLLPTPLLPNYDYYVIKKSNGDFQLSLTYAEANYTPKTFTTNFLSNATYLTITAHGLANNQAVQLLTIGTLPSPLVIDTTYYVNVINANTIELKPTLLGSAITLFNNGLGSHTLRTGFVDLTDTGTGIHSMTKQQFSMKENISSYNPNVDFITLSGTLGNAYVGLASTDVIVPNQTELVSINNLEMLLYDIKANFTDPSSLVISFNSQYKTIKELSLEDSQYVDLYKGELMKALGTSKAITRLDGLPFDVSVDDLFSKGDELVNKVMEDLQNSRNKWYLFS